MFGVMGSSARKQKKQALLAKNKRTQIILQHAMQHQAATEAMRAAHEEMAEALGGDTVEERMAEMKKNIAARRKKSMNRWNRFSGTGGGEGARGL